MRDLMTVTWVIHDTNAYFFVAVIKPVILNASYFGSICREDYICCYEKCVLFLLTYY